MPMYKVHLNFIYEEDEWVEVEAENESIAGEQAFWEAEGPNDAYDHAMCTHVNILTVEEVEE